MTNATGPVAGYAVLSLETLPVILWSGLRGRPFVVIGVQSLLPAMERMLRRTLAALMRRGFAIDPDTDQPRDVIDISNNWTYRYADIFGRIESEMEQRYAFARLSRSLPSFYAMAARHVACAETHRILNGVARARIVANHADQTARWIGLDPETRHFYRAYFGESLPATWSMPLWPRRIAALMLAAAVLLRTLAWAATRMRMNRQTAPPRALAFDFLPDPRFLDLLHEATRRPDQVCLVFRNRALREAAQQSADWRDFPGLMRGAGWIPLNRAPGWIRDFLADAWALARSFFFHPPAMGLAAVRLAARRIENRALLTRTPVQAFLARDDYNADHIVRTYALREAGILSLGINHGLPVPSIREALWRYVDFDIYYVFGAHLYDRYYASTWSSTMRVVPTGSFGPRRADLSPADGRRDIVVFLTTVVGAEEVFDWAVRLARRFPDRTITIKHKRSRAGRVYGGYAFQRPQSRPANLIESKEDSYALMARSGYALSTPNSTIAAECLYYRLPTFVWDGGATLPVSYYRDFEGLCVTDIETVIRWIEDLEAGRRTYSFDRYESLIAADAMPTAERLAADLKAAATGCRPGHIHALAPTDAPGRDGHLPQRENTQ